MTAVREPSSPHVTVASATQSRSLMLKLVFLAMGFLSLCLSVTLWFGGYREEGLFVGLWVPAIHSLGTLVLTPER